MNQLTQWVVFILGYAYVAIITHRILLPWFHTTTVADPFLEDMAKQIISFFGGIMAKTGLDAIANSLKAELPADNNQNLSLKLETTEKDKKDE